MVACGFAGGGWGGVEAVESGGWDWSVMGGIRVLDLDLVVGEVVRGRSSAVGVGVCERGISR